MIKATRHVGLGLVALFAGVVSIPLVATRPVTAVTPGWNGKIVFVSNRDRPHQDLYTMNPDGSNVTRITTDIPDPQFGLQYWDPAWSPDGTKIAAGRINGFGTTALVTMNADGSSVTPILPGYGVTSPNWSPDGQTIYFAGQIVGSQELSHIWRVGTNGSGATELTTGSNSDQEPAINPAGTKIAFSHSGEIGTMNTNGTGYVNLTPGITDASNPSWSPNGTKIVFSRYLRGLWTMNADGTGLARIGTVSYNWLNPSWSPDGSRIVFTDAGGYGPTLTSIKPDLSCQSRLLATNGAFSADDADWQPVATPTVFRFEPQGTCMKVKRGVTASTTVTVVRSGGFTGPITLSASNMPAGMNATFSPNPMTGSTTTMTVTTVACPNPTETGRVTVTGTNGATTRTGYVDVYVDTGPPKTTSGPTSTLVSGKTVSSTSVPVRTAWSGCDAYNAISFDVGRWRSSVWSAVLTNTTATSTTPSLTFDTTYRYRVRTRVPSIDGYSAYTYGPYFQPKMLQQSSTYVHYGGTWLSSSSTVYLGGSNKRSTTAGAWASYTFTGSSVAWVGAVGPDRGEAKVYIDGVLKATVNTYAASVAYRRTLYAFSWPTQGSHTIKIVVVGTAGHARVDVDAFVRLYRT